VKGFSVNKKIIAGLVGIAVALLVFLFIIDMGKRSKFEQVLAQHEEMIAISRELSVAGQKVSAIENRIGLAETQSLPVLIESIISDMGLKKNLQSVKPFGSGERADYMIQESEVELENLNLNELVNIMYGIYTAPAGLFVTSADIKKDFSDPQLLDVRMALKLVTTKGEKGK
jgi:hypothetical protein